MSYGIKNPKLQEKALEAMAENGLEVAFPADVLQQAEGLKGPHMPSEYPSIQDLRAFLWSSIDNETSRDLDQVEYASELPNGDIRLFVGIADVDEYVPKGSPIDEFAAKNTVTVYTDGGNFPILPERLSTDLTSLNEGADRVAVVIELIIKRDGSVPGNRFFRAFVRNHAKLNYASVGDWLETDENIPRKIAEIPGLEEQILLQRRAAERLYRFRCENGALEFESIESSPVFEDGEITAIAAIQTNAARRLIENFMVAANVETAEFLESHGVTSIRRVVKTPERWDGIREIASKYGANLPKEPNALALAAFLNDRRIEEPLHYPDLSLSIIKLIGGGDYVVHESGADLDGHFGLAVNDYAHSTAPNRRYADLIIQRQLKAALNGEPPPYTPDELGKIAEHCNRQETAARKVERKVRKVAAAMVMQRRLGEKFDAIVTGKTPRGTFARILRPPLDGRIVKGEENAMVGQKIVVRLVAADPEKGFIDLEHVA